MKRHTPKVISKQDLYLPKMEFLPLSDDGSGLYVRELGGKSLLKYNETLKEMEVEQGAEVSDSKAIDLMAVLLLLAVCNEDGSPYFNSKDEVDLFSEKSIRKFQIVADKAMELSGIGGAKKTLPNDLNSSSMEG